MQSVSSACMSQNDDSLVSEASSGGDDVPGESAVERTRSFGGLFSKVTLWGESHLGCPVWSLSVSRSGILCGCDDGSIVLLNSNMDCCFREQEAHAGAITQICWAGDSLHFLTVGTDLQVKVWWTNTEQGAECVYSMHQISPVISACFHPLSYSAKSGIQGSPRSLSNNSSAATSSPETYVSSCTVFVLTSDRKIRVWTNGLVEMYESISAKDALPVSMSMQSSSCFPLLMAIGCKNGDLLLYSFTPESGISFQASVSCRNKRGKFREGAPAVGVHWVSRSELVLSTQDNRVRLVKVFGDITKDDPMPMMQLVVVKKFKGHRSSGGEVPLAAFVHSAPFAQSILVVGSECGRVYVWPLEESPVHANEVAKGSSSLMSRFWKNINPSRAKTFSDTWLAVRLPDKLTAVVPAPWVPQKGRIAGASCAVAASLDGSVKLFFAEFS